MLGASSLQELTSWKVSISLLL